MNWDWMFLIMNKPLALYIGKNLPHQLQIEIIQLLYKMYKELGGNYNNTFLENIEIYGNHRIGIFSINTDNSTGWAKSDNSSIEWVKKNGYEIIDISWLGDMLCQTKRFTK